ncbi:alpha/beta hydrolase fold domain-containing protein [Variovorax fucosicus]|uniref:alpha/beta hydrolase fold domain-containing protein n=1 Tax=Variovorax fucosicus TaxID=3053517 RepID=UPI002576E84E|nr:alpha/beta hydrolase fold domain-containing protein [Variovorax sp. J22G47]MDM0058835.1 alpha/beta hydrolase fold domain-containing protein [Variovorax sp. J22G47]
MSAIALDSQLVAAFSKAAEIDRHLGPVAPGLQGVRERASLGRFYWNEGGPTLLEASQRSIPGPTRDVPVVLYRSRESSAPSPVFLFLHGGGFKLGNERSNDLQMREIAAAWGGVVISADYLHAPEHVFPAAVDEVAAVLQWLHDNGESWSMDTERVAFGGLSAGASIGFGAAVKLGRQPWLQAAVGIVGAFSFDTTSTSMREFGNSELFPQSSLIRPMFEDYVPDPGARDDPSADLTRANAEIFPTTFLAAAEYDVFRDASAVMAARLKEAGRLHSFKIYPRMAHLFFGFSREVECAANCVSDVAHFLAERLPAVSGGVSP